MRICSKCRGELPDEIAFCPTDGTKLLPLGDKVRDPRIGTFAQDRFLLLDILDAGGMSGGIYRGQQLNVDRPVAIKVLSAHDLTDLEFVERFKGEAKIIANLGSPHTVKCFDFGHLDSGELYIAMELCSGRSLEQILREERTLGPDLVTSIVSQICLSLEEAHKKGLVHRDLKPSNVMIEGEHVKLLDFGLAKKVSSEEGPNPTISRAGHFYGSFPYAAPEMWAPEEFGDVGPETDIYALGILIYELLAGTRPFVASGQIDWAHRHLYDRPHLLSSAVPFPRPFLPIVEKCLAKRKEDRYRSIVELRNDVIKAGKASASSQGWREPGLSRPRYDLLSPVTRGATGMFLAFAMPVIGVGSLLGRASHDSPVRVAPVSVVVDSEPRGAAILFDGEPIGFTTPATFQTLPKDRMVEISVAKDGRIAKQSIRLEPGKRESVTLLMSARAE